jgi:hypothetical protein
MLLQPDGVYIDVERYLAQSGVAAQQQQPTTENPARISNATATTTTEAVQPFDWSPTLAAFLRQDYDNEPPEGEEEDGDFLPSSPRWQAGNDDEDGNMPMEAVVERDTKDDDNDQVARKKNDSTPTPDATPAETPATGDEDGQRTETEDDDDEGDSEDDLEYDEDEWDDDGLFLPIEDVPIPKELQQAQQQAAVPLLPPVPPASTQEQDKRASNPQRGQTDGVAHEQAADNGTTPASSKPEGVGLPESFASALAAAALLNPAAWNQTHPTGAGLGGGGVAAGLDSSTPDRGYGIGRGVQLGQDATALMRQIYILTQNQVSSCLSTLCGQEANRLTLFFGSTQQRAATGGD